MSNQAWPESKLQYVGEKKKQIYKINQTHLANPMAYSCDSKTKCDPCQLQAISKDAILWCQQCEEGLCEECNKYHKVLKSTRKHSTIPLESFATLPSFIHGIDLTCSVHNENLDLFCGIHQEACCTECVSLKHTTCGGITLLSKVVQGVKKSEYVSTLEKNITEQRTLTEKLKQNRNENESRLQEQKRMLHDKVTILRQNINDKLDRIELKIKNEIDHTIDLEVATIKEAKLELENTVQKLDEQEKHISILCTHCTEMQTYHGLKEIEKNLDINKQKFISLLKGKGMQNISVSIDTSKALENLMSEIDTLGSVKTTEEELGIDIAEMNPGIAQMSKPLNAITDTIQLNLVRRSKIPNVPTKPSNICSAVILHDGRIVLLDCNYSASNGYLYIFDANGFYIRKTFCNYSPFGMAVLGQNELLVSSCSDTSHFFYDTNITLTKTIEIGYKLMGLSFNEGQIISAIRGTGIAASVTLDKILKIYPVDDPTLAYVHCANEKIFFTDYPNNTLICLGISSGEELWRCKFDEMKGPRNICSDKFGNLFVASTDSDKVLMISSDGKTCKQMLGNDVNVIKPKAICLDKTGSTLVVANMKGTFSIYNVIY